MTINNLIYLGVFVLFALGVAGWIGNAYKLTQTDFASPYKTEVIRTVGIFMPPVGAVTGWMTIGEENK